METTNGSEASVRVVLFDYQKPFDLVDHTLIIDKLKSQAILNSTITGIADFLTNRQQRVELGKDCFSEWGNAPAGGTKLGRWLFVLMINDLCTTSFDDQLKFGDDVTVPESVPKFPPSNKDRMIESVLETLHTRRKSACKKLFNQILADPRHKLNDLVGRLKSPLRMSCVRRIILYPKVLTDRLRPLLSLGVAEMNNSIL